VDAAWQLSRNVRKAASVEAILSTCDYVTIHIPLNKETKGFLNADKLQKAKKGVRILNFSRGDLVDNAAVKEAVSSGTIACYITDFPNEELLGVDGIIPIPHLGASTQESEDNCAVMAASQLRDYLEHGIIKNSVNFPDCDLPNTTNNRFCVIHKNIPNIVGPLTSEVARHGINIENMINKSKGEYAYTIIDVNESNLTGLTESLGQIEGIIRVRLV
jgi:D-3-phosphoglycerate dehydrogenase